MPWIRIWMSEIVICIHPLDPHFSTLNFRPFLPVFGLACHQDAKCGKISGRFRQLTVTKTLFYLVSQMIVACIVTELSVRQVTPMHLQSQITSDFYNGFYYTGDKRRLTDIAPFKYDMWAGLHPCSVHVRAYMPAISSLTSPPPHDQANPSICYICLNRSSVNKYIIYNIYIYIYRDQRSFLIMNCNCKYCASK